MDNYEIAPYANLLVYKKGITFKEAKAIIKDKKLEGLRIFAHLKDDRLDSLDFLKDYSFLERLDIASVVDYNFEFLESLSQLKSLSIDIEGTNEINLSHLYNLKSLTINGNHPLIGFEDLLKLNYLSLMGYNEDILTIVAKQLNLKELTISSSPIKTLNGLQNLTYLEKISLRNCKKLISIKELNNLSNLRDLKIDTCPKLNNISYLTNLPNLSILKLNDCKGIQSLDFLVKLNKLTELYLLGNTNILNGDLKPAANIMKVYTRNRSHYNIKFETHAQEQIINNNLEYLKRHFEN